MNRFLILVFCGLSLIINYGCRQNKLKSNQKELSNEILAQDKVKHEAGITTHDNKSPNASGSYTGSFHKNEIRSVDPRKPPINLDLLRTSTDTRKLKLSDVASAVNYVKLETPPDTVMLYDPSFFHNDLHSNVRSDGEQIIFQGLFGLTRFNKQGEYQETIWKNKTGIKFYKGGIMYGGKDFSGVLPNNPISIPNGNLYYSFQDGPRGNSHVMKYKLGINKNISFKSKTEIPGPGTILGDTLLNSNKIFPDGFDYIFGTGIDSWAGVNQKWNAGKSGVMLVTYNDKGDTLCKFTDYNRISNFTKSNYRNPEKLASYYFNGLLTIKQEYNDTVFRLIPPDRLLPIFNIVFGDYKVNYMDGLNPNFDLSGKYLLNSLQETNDYLFISYIQYYTPVTKKEKGVKFYYALFDKKEGKLYNQPGFTLEPDGIINDLDGGIPFWPDFITPQGEMMKLVSGKMIKDYVNSDEFKEASISENHRQKQILMASGLKPTDMIVLFVK